MPEPQDPQSTHLPPSNPSIPSSGTEATTEAPTEAPADASTEPSTGPADATQAVPVNPPPPPPVARHSATGAEPGPRRDVLRSRWFAPALTGVVGLVLGVLIGAASVTMASALWRHGDRPHRGDGRGHYWQDNEHRPGFGPGNRPDIDNRPGRP